MAGRLERRLERLEAAMPHTARELIAYLAANHPAQLAELRQWARTLPPEARQAWRDAGDVRAALEIHPWPN